MKNPALMQKEYGENLVCPRCLGAIPSNENPGAYPGAGSRMTRHRNIEICSDCGRDEAMGNGLVPVDDWPIRTATTPEKVRSETKVWDGTDREKGLQL